jgi:hypothetical protein
MAVKAILEQSLAVSSTIADYRRDVDSESRVGRYEILDRLGKGTHASSGVRIPGTQPASAVGTRLRTPVERTFGPIPYVLRPLVTTFALLVPRSSQRLKAG